MKILLQCGHVISVPREDYEARYDCPHCGMSVAVQAFECREYHVKCFSCRYGRWFGQDRETAARAHDKPGHNVQLAYMVFPAKREKVKDLYGRKVKLIVPDVPTAVRNPDMRTWIPLISEVSEDAPPY